MIKRATDATRINEILNHPAIHPWVSGNNEDMRDVTDKLSHPNFIGLEGEGGCFIVQHIQTGIYDFHTAVLPDYQGNWASNFFVEGLEWMFTKTNAVELMTKCPRNNRASKAACVRSGFEHAFPTRPLYSTTEGLVPFDVYSMTIQKWARGAEYMRSQGEWFHQALDIKYAAQGKSLKVHAEDAVHDQYVGITVKMMMAGFPQKAVSFYNRWALLSSYEPIFVVSLDPLVIDIYESRLLIANNHFEVL